MTLVENSVATPSPREITTKPRRSDQVFRLVVFLGGLSSLVTLSAIALFLGIRGYEILVSSPDTSGIPPLMLMAQVVMHRQSME